MTYSSLWRDLYRSSFSQGYLDAGGIRTRYMSSGSPDLPLLLFLHGTGGHAEAYTRNLAAHGEHFWTLAIDMVGHGWTDKPDIAYEIPEYVDHVVNVIKALGRSSAHISGESLGAWVASYMAMRTPQWVDRLVLNTAGGWTAHPPVMAQIKKLSLEAVDDPSYERLKARLEFLMYDKSLVHDDLVEARRAIYAQQGYRATMEKVLCLQEMEIRRRNMFTREDYATITADTLVLWTSHDPTASVAEGQEIASMISGSKFVVMQDCGHWPQFENPPEFNDIHLGFLRG